MLRQTLSVSFRALRSTPLRPASESLLRQPSPLPFLARPVQPSVQPSVLAVSRWYSEAKETSEKEASVNEQTSAEQTPASRETPSPRQGEEAGAEGSPAAADNGLSELKQALEVKENEAREWKDKCLRSVADFRNLQERTKREVKTARDFAISKLVKDVVDNVDTLDLALKMFPQEKLNAADKSEELKDLTNLYQGLHLTHANLMQTLVKHGVEQVNPEGQKFDPNEHEAVFMTPMPDKESNTVCHVQQKGYKLNGRVLRAAKVGVVSSSTEAS
ncbi:hypothetical protein XA68_15270 [Ophiocordyceps unilateralis]|uniref:GrpE protein homolog n=1 Tax=Ophiocordyceps unilateralis TaxID=268505 RepID=A0A2A9PMF8_OPHUN|nr:hypothetical protein XA68_15270 [Ophiocordyceps unilateralis]